MATTKLLCSCCKSIVIVLTLITKSDCIIFALYSVEMEEMEIQLDVGKKQQAVLKAHLEEVDDREKQGDDRHLEHMKAREAVLKEKEVG